MTNIVQQDASQCSVCLLAGDLMPLEAQIIDCFIHQIHRPYGVVQTRMLCSRIHKGSQAQLANALQTLKDRVLDELIEKIVGYGDESENRIVDYFLFIRH